MPVAAEKSKNPRLIIIVGPTAAGKSELAVRLAEQFDGEIINADSMQVYRGMEIGTAKPSAQLLQRVPHHLLDVVEPDINFTASDFRRLAKQKISEIHERGKNIFIVGGTGLYIRALLHGLVDSPGGAEELREELKSVAREAGNEELLRRLAQVDPATAARLHPNDQVRIIRALEVYFQSGRPISEFRGEHGFGDREYVYLMFGLNPDRDELYQRIEARVDAMLEEGLVAEVEGLLASGYTPDLKALRSIGYKEICAYLAGSFPLEEAVRLIKRDTRRYAKRQLTWFVKEEEINWVEYPKSFATICNHVIEFLA